MGHPNVTPNVAPFCRAASPATGSSFQNPAAPVRPQHCGGDTGEDLQPSTGTLKRYLYQTASVFEALDLRTQLSTIHLSCLIIICCVRPDTARLGAELDGADVPGSHASPRVQPEGEPPLPSLKLPQDINPFGSEQPSWFIMTSTCQFNWITSC